MPTEINGAARIDDLMRLRFAVLIVSTAQGAAAHCRDLGLITTGTSPAEALAAMEAAKRDFFERYVKAGEPVALVPSQAADEVPDDGPLTHLALRSMVATLSVAGTLGVIVLLLGLAAGSVMPSSGQFMDSAWNVVGTFGDLAPDRAERWRAQAAAATAKLQPIFAEFAPLFPAENCRP